MYGIPVNIHLNVMRNEQARRYKLAVGVYRY